MNTASVIRPQPIGEISEADWDEIIAVGHGEREWREVYEVREGSDNVVGDGT
jgi:hypothetical protein